MTPFDKLCSDITLHLDRKEGSGWYSINCPVCKETRTRTGGFMFTPESVVYNCFRGKCDASCAYELDGYVSKKFKRLMETLGVKIPVELLVAKKKSEMAALMEDESHLYKKHSYKAIELPEGFVPLEKSKNRSFREHAELLFSRRRCSLEDVFVADSGKYKGLPAFGMYLHEKLIGVNIVTDHGYVSHFGGNSNVLYTPSRNFNSDPIILVEGGLDAKCFPNTAATLSNKITPEQAFFLRGRNVICVPDRKGGNKFIDQFSQYGWGICIPPWEEKDLNAAVMTYGKLAVARKIVENTTKDLLTAKARYKLWCID